MSTKDYDAGNLPWGDWMQVYPAAKFHPNRPEATDFNVESIFHSLSHQCRYGGHCKHFYSVLQHSILIARHVWAETGDPVRALQGLLHDGTEAYLVDVPRPVKVNLADYYELERRIAVPLFHHFGLPVELDEAVKRADLAICYDEGRALFDVVVEDWTETWAPGLDLDPDVFRERPFGCVRFEAEKLYAELRGAHPIAA